MLPIAIAVVVMLVAGLFIDRQNQQIAAARQRADVIKSISLIRARFEGHINGNVQLLKGLASAIATEPNLSQVRFDRLMTRTFEERSQLLTVAAAPDLVIKRVYPPAKRAALMGLDYRTLTSAWPSVQRMIESGQIDIGAPSVLLQGGEGMILRMPVYVGNQQDRHFWGIVSAVIDHNDLYLSSGLYANPGLLVSISVPDQPPFVGPDLREDNPARAEVKLPSGVWQIEARPLNGWGIDAWSLWSLRAMLLVAGALILLPIAITARMIGERHAHIRAMAEREAELTRLSRRLNLAMEVSQIGVWEMNLETGQESWDTRTNELYGLTPDDVARTHDHWRAAVHPEDRDRAETDFRRMIKSGHYASDYRVVLPNGTVRYVRSIGALFSEPGQPDKVIGANWDVTSDIQLSEDLRRAKQQAELRNHELEAVRVRIEHNAMHDSLTGLPNRRYLDEVLQRHAADGYHGSGSIALLHIDLDRFKQINDTLGHSAGDAMLVHASQILRTHCRETDFVARIGGDEFVIVSSAGSNDSRLGIMAERIVREMRDPAQYDGHEIRFGVSIGVAVSRTSQIDVRQLLVNADIALYRAKARGRNRYEFFSEALQAEVVTNKRIGDDILKGLETGAFVPFYQPQFCAQTLAVTGVEALARWHHPTRGLLSPDQFIAIAEELNVVADIDRQILEQSLADLARWDDAGLNVPRVSVNVSLRRLHDETLVDSLKTLPIEPGRIAFELVESIYLDESDGIVGWNIDHIKDLGIDVEIDDFGTGYASIVSLQKLRPRRLKIDRQLVMPILDQPAQRLLVASIVDIGKAMNIDIVAEGVETIQHATILRDLGCDILQGYAFAKPMPRQDLEAFLGAGHPALRFA